MLKVRNIRRLADYIENEVSSGYFNMGSCSRCIAGQANRLKKWGGGVGAPFNKAAAWLGLTPKQAFDLFFPELLCIGLTYGCIDRNYAALVLRRLATTNKVRWL